MAFFRTVTLSEQVPAIVGDGIVLRAPQMSDYAEWAALREASRDFLTPWEPTWPADDLTRSAFRRRIKRYTEDQRGDLAYPFFIVHRTDEILLGGLTRGMAVQTKRPQVIIQDSSAEKDDRTIYLSASKPLEKVYIFNPSDQPL